MVSAAGRTARQTPPVDWDDVFGAAALDPHRWHDALATMAHATGASHGQLIGIDAVAVDAAPADRGRARRFNLISDFDVDLSAQGPEVGLFCPQDNYRIVAARRAAPAGAAAVVHERDYDAARRATGATAYEEFCERVGIPFGNQTNLLADAAGVIGFATLRNRADGQATARQRAIFTAAAQAARRAVRLQERLADEQARLMAGHFDMIGLAAFILDARGAVRATTMGAQALLSAGRIRLRHGRVEAAGTPLSLRTACDALTLGGARHVRLRLDAPDGTGAGTGAGQAAPVFVEGFRLPRLDWEIGAAPCAILIAGRTPRDRAEAAGFLAALYRLSPAEADVVLRLHAGETRVNIAGDRSMETLRTHLKTIYAKTGTDGEPALIRTIAAIMA